MPVTAAILSVGEELVLGQTVDTNSAWLSQKLAGVGVPVLFHQTVGDTQADIERALRDASNRAGVVIVSGGIGPTDDDLTRQALAAALGVELETDPAWMKHMAEFFERLGRPMPEANVRQAGVPRGATKLWNHHGTAAGLRATLGSSRIFVMPGVPKEMKAMFERDVLPEIRAEAGGGVILQSLQRTFGVGESTVGEKLGDLMARDRNPRVGTTVSGGEVGVRINAHGATLGEATRLVAQTRDAVRSALGDLVYGEDDDNLASAVARTFRERPNVTIATAESCTGGLVAKYLTDESGSSAHLVGGWVTYSNDMKTSELGVDASLIQTHGAVSEQVAAAMVDGARRRASTTYAVSVTGIAGPTGGSEQKPVGTVCFGLATPRGVTTYRFVFPGDRSMIRDRAAKMALTLLRFGVLDRPLPF